MPRDRWAECLDFNLPAAEVLTHLPHGSSSIERIYPPPAEQRQLGLAP